MKRNRLLSFFLIFSILLTGCGAQSSVGQEITRIADYTNDQSIDHTQNAYDVPVMQPNILVNRLGYEPDGQKVAIFRGDELPEEFHICDANTKDVVFTGKIKDERFDNYYKENDGFGDFSEFNEQGDFYIRAEGIGESYPFMIHDSLYYSLFCEACKRFYEIRSNKAGATSQDEGWVMEQSGQNKETLASRTLYMLLLSYELFPNAYTDDIGIAESGNGVPDILDECSYEASWILNRAASDPGEDVTAVAYRVAMLCKLYESYKTIEPTFSMTCLKEAQSSYKTLIGHAEVPLDERFMAEAELYRATGLGNLKALVEQYMTERLANPEGLVEADFFGVVAYLATAGKTDVTICDKAIKRIMDEAERIAANAGRENYFVFSEEASRNPESLFSKVVHMCVVNHVITNYEYNTVIENHFHYLMGRNPQGICHALGWNGKDLAPTDIFANPYQNAQFIFILSELISNND
ncbi:MAG: glycoside hydrolase family 9 protein [Lachnospiraceae bacterium]|nr:glycoside hydrolase family 9 protein [Lachnospiraceae bacterium]